MIVTVDWMNPLNKLRWQEAIRNRKRTVTMLDGRRFTLDYGSGPHSDNVFFEPIPTPGNKGLVPRGTFSIEKVTDDDWID